MRILWLLIGVILCLSVSSQTTNVLFLGNSYTASNQMTQIFSQLSFAAGDTVYTEAMTPGGYTLGMPGSGHLSNPNSLNLIMEGIWDHVVLQEQSQMPTIPYYRDNFTFPAADSLNKIIQQSNDCCVTTFFMTWGRKYGGQQCINGYCSPVFVDFFHMQDSLESAYMHMAYENNAFCSPVGIAWANSIAYGDSIELFAGDGSHPSLAGSYLAACTFYAVIFNKSPVGINYYAGLDANDALYLQQVADYTVLSDPGQWNISYPEPAISSFTYELQGKLAEFINTSSHAVDFLWDFGDPASGTQNTSTQANPSHNFSDTGIFVVSLKASDSCTYDISYDTLNVLLTSIDEQQPGYEVEVFPNPVQDKILIRSSYRFHSFRLRNIQGQNEMEGSLHHDYGQSQITGLSGLSPGIYMLQLIGDNQSHMLKIILSK